MRAGVFAVVLRGLAGAVETGSVTGCRVSFSDIVRALWLWAAFGVAGLVATGFAGEALRAATGVVCLFATGCTGAAVRVAVGAVGLLATLCTGEALRGCAGAAVLAGLVCTAAALRAMGDGFVARVTGGCGFAGAGWGERAAVTGVFA